MEYTPSGNTDVQLEGAPGFVSEPGCPGFSSGQECIYTIKTSVPAVPITEEVLSGYGDTCLSYITAGLL